MWNQNGNGNNNGYGQPQQQPQQAYGDDVYGRLDRARQIDNRDPYIEAGTHTLAVISLEEVDTQDKGKMVRGTFLVLESTSMRPGTKASEVWFLQKPPPKTGMVTDSDRFADFACRLKGAPQGYPIGADIRVLLRDRAAEQLARGMVIRCVGIVKRAKTTGKDYCVKNWSNVEQSPQQIAEMRQKIETTPGLVEQPRSTGGYVPPQMPQAAPPMQQPQQQWQQPQTPPMQQAPQQPQGVPPGGFLANVPPQGNGGKQGGGW